MVDTRRSFYVYAITFDQDTFGVYATQNEAEESLAKQIVDGGPAWDGCRVSKWLVQGEPEQDALWQKDYDALSKSRDDLAEQIDKYEQALRAALACTGHWGANATEPAICRDCQQLARDALTTENVLGE